MNFDQNRIEDLISRLAESLNVEVKRWIDPDKPSGMAKIVRASLALRNRNGGYLVIGFDDKSLQPDVGNEPQDVRAAFHIDKIQGIISRYSYELFEIGVGYSLRNGQEYPVIVVPEGLTAPVAAKADLMDGAKRLISRGDVYCRTLAANGTPSTSLARPEDWRDIVEICFENREADFGRFLRRHLGGRDIATLRSALGPIDYSMSPPAPPTLRARAEFLLNDGDQRCQKALNNVTLAPEQKPLAEGGSWSVGLVIDPPQTAKPPDQVFLNTLASSNPQYTGWPVWLDSRSFVDRSHAPKVKDKAWETLILAAKGWTRHFDFYRFDPKGEFYLRRNLQDDVSDKVKPRMALDPVLVLIRVAEAIAVGLAFAKGLGWKEEETRLGFAFRWTKLSGRELTPWANPMVLITAGHAHDDEVTTFTELSLDTPVSAIAPFAEQATQDLFALFDGYKMPTAAVEEWVRRLIERRLG